MKEKIEQAKKITKELFLTKQGLLSLLLANIFWSSFWFVPLVFGFITNQNQYYAIAGSIYIFFVQPLIPMWLFTPLTALFIKNNLIKK
jgi:hypothetical protein